LTKRLIKAPRSALPRFRTWGTNSKNPQSRGNFTRESPRRGRSHERSNDQNPSIDVDMDFAETITILVAGELPERELPGPVRQAA
jgi:hypothetical protein